MTDSILQTFYPWCLSGKVIELVKLLQKPNVPSALCLPQIIYTVIVTVTYIFKSVAFSGKSAIPT